MHCINVMQAILLALYCQGCTGCSRTQEGSDYIADCHREVLDDIPSEVLDLTTHILFSFNTLSNLTYNDMLSRFFNLKLLDVSYNYLSQDSFYPDVFSKIKTLTTVNLQGNRITRVPSPLIRNAQIRILLLDNNAIKHISAGFLMDLPKLEELTLSNCGIQTISAQAFKHIDSKLQRLDLSNNALETLSIDLAPDIFTDRLLSIKLYDNFWNCDCHLKWLRERMSETSAHWFFMGYELVPSCEEPKSLKHKSWFEARAELYGCPPELLNVQTDFSTTSGSNITIHCTVLTYTPPNDVQWLQNNVTIDYKSQLAESRAYNGSHFATNLTVTSLTDKDIGLYQCSVNTSFGSVVQKTRVDMQVSLEITAGKMGTVIASAVVATVVVVVLIVVMALVLKKRVVHRGKLYMDARSDRSQKSDMDISMDNRAGEEDHLVSTSFNMPDDFISDDQPDVIKCYSEDDLDSLPADTEYPADDAGCAEYNEFLEAVSSSNHSPAYLEPTNHSPAYMESTNNGAAYIRTVSPNTVYSDPPLRDIPFIPPEPSDPSSSPAKMDPLANHNGDIASRPNSIVPYVATLPDSTINDSAESLSEVVINRLAGTPSASPLTFIKEDPNEDASADLL